MGEVAIVGAGELGGLVAHALARRNLARAIRLIDANGPVAQGKALDIGQAAPIEHFTTTVTGSSDLSTAAGAGIIVIADPVPTAGSGPIAGDDRDDLSLLRQLHAIAPRALYVCSDVAHRELVERAVREVHIPRLSIFGSAGEALASAAIAIVALELDMSPRDVSLAVLGAPPDRIVIAWEDGSASGFALRGLLSEARRRDLTRRIAALWPVGPYVLASAVCKFAEAAEGHTRRSVIVFVAPDDEAGVRTRCCALPVRFGAAGVQVATPRLTAVERIALDNAMMV